MKKLYSSAYLILALGSLLLSQSGSAQLMNFDNPVLINGVSNEVGAVYRYQNVKPGMDAIVTVDSIVSGAVLKDIDKTGWGYNEAFQPFIQPPNGVNASAYVVFTMKFVVTSTITPSALPVLSMTVLDIDGSNNIKEFDIVDMNGGTATYNSTPSEILVTGIGPAFKGINVTGIGHGGPDTTVTADIFTVTNINISQLTIKCGTEGTTSSNTARKYSFFPAAITYPAAIITLPVRLVTFSATLNNDSKADLKWTTASEANVSHFVVEKSYDGINFSDAGIVFAFGNTNDTKNYSFSDNVNLSRAGMIYYRLRSVDSDGKSQLSQARIIRIGKASEMLKLTTYPNPVSNEIRITVPAAWQNKEVTIEIFNPNGQKLKSSKASNASQTEIIAVSNLGNGFYILKASCGSETAQQKFIKN